jgi:hypothetical protein
MSVTILVIGRNVQIMETILRLINRQPNWQAVGALTDEEALKLFPAQPFDLVLIGGGVDESSEQDLSIAFKKINPAIKIIRHYGGGSGLLFNEILGATSPSLG